MTEVLSNIGYYDTKYPACTEWYIQNPDNTYMSIDMNSGRLDISNYTLLNNVKVYHQGSYYTVAPLYKTQDGWWWVHFSPKYGTRPLYYHIISGQCTPPQPSQPQPPSQPSPPQPQPITPQPIAVGGSSSSASTNSLMNTILKYKWYIIALIFIIIVIYFITKR